MQAAIFGLNRRVTTPRREGHALGSGHQQLIAYQGAAQDAANSWYIAGGNSMAQGSQTITVKRIYAIPHFFDRDIKIDHLGLMCATGGASAICRVGIYDDVWKGGYPGRLLAATGDLTPTANATAYSAPIGGRWLRGGYTYWFALLFISGTAPVLTGLAAANEPNNLGLTTISSNGSGSWNFTYGTAPTAMPCTFPSAAVKTGNLGMPGVFYRVAA